MPQRSSPCPCAVKSFCVCHPIFEPRRPSDAGAARLCARCSFTGTHSPAMHLAFMGISPLRGSLRGALLCCDGSHRRSDFAGSFPPNGEKPACSATPPLPIKPFDSAGSPSMLQRSTSGLDASIFNASACHGLRCGCAAPTESGAPIRRPAHSACRFPDSRRKVKNALYNSVVKGRLSFRKVKGQEERVLAFLACIGTKTRFRGVSQSNFFQKASSFFLASLSDSLTLYSETPSIFAISFAVRFSA